jgi:hypothetical protein
LVASARSREKNSAATPPIREARDPARGNHGRLAGIASPGAAGDTRSLHPGRGLMTRTNALVVGLIVAGGALGCNKVVKNTSDKSPPQVEIKVRGADGQYAAASTAKLSATTVDQLEWMCIVSDASGVRSVSITYASSLDGCTIQSGVWSCAASYEPHPKDLFQKLEGDATGKVLDKLPMLATVKGPFSCSCPGQGTGAPFGRTIRATCTGANWSSDASKATTHKVLTIELQ